MNKAKLNKLLDNQNYLFSALLSNLQIGVFMVEAPSGKPLIANETALNLLGRGILPNVTQENLSHVYAAYKNDISTPYPLEEMPIILGMYGKSSHIDDMLVIRPDGTVTYLEVFGSPVPNEDGHIFASLVSFSDITERKKTESLLQESQGMLLESQAVANICAYITELTPTNLNKSLWKASPQFYKIFGIDKTYPHTIEGWIGFIHPDFREEMIAYHEHVVKEKIPFNHDYKIIRINDGVERWVHGTGELEYNDQGEPIRMMGAIQDITERKKAQSMLELMKNTIEQSSDSIFWSTLNGRFINVNQAACNLLGYTRDELLKLSIPDIDVNENALTIEKTLMKLRNIHSSKFNAVHRAKDGRLIPVEIVSTYVKFEGDEIICGFVRDNTKRQQLEEIQRLHYEELQKIAIHDDLTGIYNRRQGISLLEIEISKAKRLHNPLCCLMLDIDHFKKINDTYGHSVGDKVLIQITAQIQKALRPYDIFFRFGGEEFVIIIPNQNLKEGRMCAQRIVKLCDEAHFLPLDSTSFLHVTLSIGLSVLKPTDTSDELLKRSDVALYEAKNGGRNQVREVL